MGKQHFNSSCCIKCRWRAQRCCLRLLLPPRIASKTVATCYRSVSSTRWNDHPSTSEFSVKREILRKNGFVSLECTGFLPEAWAVTFWLGDELPSEGASGRGEQAVLFLECQTGVNDQQVLRDTLEVQELKPCITWKDKLPQTTLDEDIQEAGSF